MVETGDCPCGTGAPFAQCCGPLLGGAPAPTALALMRSRYTAYVRGAVDYLVATQAEELRGGLDRAALARWARETRWTGLEIVTAEHGGAGDTEGVVEFIARGVSRGAPFAQRERSRFRRDGGRWYYVDGKAGGAPARTAAKPGRNEPCSCGSGMKYKRCCGK